MNGFLTGTPLMGRALPGLGTDVMEASHATYTVAFTAQWYRGDDGQGLLRLTEAFASDQPEITVPHLGTVFKSRLRYAVFLGRPGPRCGGSK